MADLNTFHIESQLSSINSAIGSLESRVSSLSKQGDRVEESVEQIRQDLNKLAEEFVRMEEDQKRAAALQKAITELVRVRQEIGQRYGNYSVTRETMLGVLQATDAALVKKTTISRVSEELMLSTPQYWLAPCLVAVSAWISNDRDLAERAIAEAMKRDEEKTALCMALICRRNGRIETGYEWLSIYFSKQSASSITEETFTYIDAYVNGVFGPDEKHMCQGYVGKWIDEIRGNRSSFEADQERKWEEYCGKFKIDVRELYPELASASPDFEKINESIGCISSYAAIRDDFKGITDAYVDQDALKKTIDNELIHLISNYDKSEIEIRREEEYLSLVKYFEGDEEKAKKEMIAREAKRQQHKLDFIEQMSSEITSGLETAPSKRRTAVAFLSGYINKGYTRYIDDARSMFPKSITVNVDQWSGESNDGTEFEALSEDYERKMKEVRDDAINHAVNVKPKTYMILAIILFVLGAAGIFMMPPVGAVLIAAGGFLLIKRNGEVKNTESRVNEIHEEFAKKIDSGKTTLNTTLQQWHEAKEVVARYDDEGEHKVA